MKKVMVFGTFDMLHLGHIDYFKKAKTYGDFLICVVSRDKTTEILKKKRPSNNEIKRLNKIKKVPLVDKAILGKLEDKFKVIKDEKPDFLVFGYDQKSFNLKIEEKIKELNLNCKIKTLKKGFKIKDFKSSNFKFIRSKVIKEYKKENNLCYKVINLKLNKKDKILKQGVYGVEAFIGKNKKEYYGLLNIINKPTIKKTYKEIYEIHILNFNKNIYNKDLTFKIMNRIRNIKKFKNSIMFEKQIEKDKKFFLKFLENFTYKRET